MSQPQFWRIYIMIGFCAAVPGNRVCGTLHDLGHMPYRAGESEWEREGRCERSSECPGPQSRQRSSNPSHRRTTAAGAEAGAAAATAVKTASKLIFIFVRKTRIWMQAKESRVGICWEFDQNYWIEKHFSFREKWKCGTVRGEVSQLLWLRRCKSDSIIIRGK